MTERPISVEMKTFTVLLVFALFEASIQGHHGSHDSSEEADDVAASFISQLSATAQTTYYQILHNATLTHNQKTAALSALATENGLQAQFEAAQANWTALQTEIEQNITNTIQGLPTAYNGLKTIQSNTNLTEIELKNQTLSYFAGLDQNVARALGAVLEALSHGGADQATEKMMQEQLMHGNR